MTDMSLQPILVEDVSFWWVWTKRGSPPRYFHPSYESAVTEAARLARKYPDRKFIVLEAVSKFSLIDPEDTTA